MGMSSTFNEPKEQTSAQDNVQVLDEGKDKTCTFVADNKSIIQIVKDDSRGSVLPASSKSPLGAALKKPAEVFRTDFIAGMKISESHSLPNGNYLDLKDTWRTEWEKGVQVPVNPDSLPEIQFRIKDSNEHVNKRRQSFHLPESRISFDNPADAVIRDQTGISSNYDLDEMDSEWIKGCVELRQKKNEIDEITMERAITYFERKCFENMVHAVTTKEGLSIEYDESTICDVCLSPDTEEGNEIVFCDACNMCAHQVCYGLLEIPHGNWLCRPCSRGILAPPCVLCPNKGGALKRVKDSYEWVHVICAWWIPEVKIEDTDNIENITVNKIPQSRWNLTCNLCREKMGACVQCSVKRCVRAYHITCAIKEGLEMKTVVIPEKDDVQHTSYCSKHCIPQPSGEKKTKGEIAENQRLDELKKLETEFYKLVTIKQAARDLHVSKEAVRKLFSYWTLKRKANDNVPLIPLTAEQKEQLSGKQGIIFIHEQMNMEAARFTILRQDLERLRNLCYMIVKREKARRELHRSSYEIFYKQHDMLTKESLSKEDETWVATGNQYARFVGFPHYTAKADYLCMSGISESDIEDNKSKDEMTELSKFRELLGNSNCNRAKTEITKLNHFNVTSLDINSFYSKLTTDTLRSLELPEETRSNTNTPTGPREKKKRRRWRASRYSYNPPKKRKKVIKPLTKSDSAGESLMSSNDDVSPSSPLVADLTADTETSGAVTDVDSYFFSDKVETMKTSPKTLTSLSGDPQSELRTKLISSNNENATIATNADDTDICKEESTVRNDEWNPDSSKNAKPINDGFSQEPLSSSTENSSFQESQDLSNTEPDTKYSDEDILREKHASYNASKVLQDSENIPKDCLDGSDLNKWANCQSNGDRNSLDISAESENVDFNNADPIDTEPHKRGSRNLNGCRNMRNSKSPLGPKQVSYLRNYRRLSPRLNKFPSPQDSETRQIIDKLKNESNHVITLEDFEKPQRITRSRRSLLKTLDGSAKS